MNVSVAGATDSRAAFDRLLADLRPKLHRYCARMTGSVIDGEDVVQDAEPDDLPLPVLAESQRTLLAAYIDRFNARDFDAVRDMLAEEVRLELVNRLRLRGRGDVANYFTRYAQVEDWLFVLGLVDRRPALLA